MTTLREAAQQALEKLEFFAHMKSVSEDTTGLITALKAALAEPEQEPPTDWEAVAADQAMTIALMKAEPVQEPVAWMCADESLVHKGYSRFSRTCHGDWNIPVYTAPPQRPAEPVQEPVAWIYEFYADRGHPGLAFEPQSSAWNTPLYTRPAKEVSLETVYETIVSWDEGGGKRSRRHLARTIVKLFQGNHDTI